MSMLPVWDVKKTEHNGAKVFQITCPACGEACLVSRKWTKPRWVRVDRFGPSKVMIVGRCCPYCHKTAQVPAEFPGGKERG